MRRNHSGSENGSAGVKLVLVLVILILTGNAGYNYIPVAYNGENVKQEIHAAILQGLSAPISAGTPVDVCKKKLNYAAKVNDLPSDTFIEVKQVNGLLQARVAYIKQVPLLPFGIYNYQYQFDHTANTHGFLTKQ
jgi:hypothetical protein